MKNEKLLIAVMAIAVMAGSSLAQEPVAKQTLFNNVKVFNGIDDKLIAQDVLVEGNLITKMGKGLKAGKDAIVIDGGGHVLMPGIIEAHNHLSLPVSPEEIINDKDWFYVGAAGAEEARRYLMRGWTTVRDIGGPTQGLKHAIDDGVVLGPRI